MDTTSPSRWLEAQHRQIDQGIEGMLNGTGTLGQLAASLDLLRLHLYIEEVVLFPPLEKAGLTMPVFVMQREHGQMWPLLQWLAAACATGTIGPDVRDEGDELLSLLQIHNPKEERILYSVADQQAARQADGALLQALQAARVPSDWACVMAGR